MWKDPEKKARWIEAHRLEYNKRKNERRRYLRKTSRAFKEKEREYAKRYYSKHRGEIIAKNAKNFWKWREKKPDKVKEYRAKYTQKNREHIREYNRKYYHSRRKFNEEYKIKQKEYREKRKMSTRN